MYFNWRTLSLWAWNTIKTHWNYFGFRRIFTVTLTFECSSCNRSSLMDNMKLKTAWLILITNYVNLLFQTLSEDSSFLLLLAYQRIRGFAFMRYINPRLTLTLTTMYVAYKANYRYTHRINSVNNPPTPSPFYPRIMLVNALTLNTLLDCINNMQRKSVCLNP